MPPLLRCGTDRARNRRTAVNFDHCQSTGFRVAHVRDGSKPDKLTARICFPLCPRERTSRFAVGMSVSCQSET